jgi:tRNA threonylcarbamoyladenosine modification (KEOPS) complex  Pcc1 subunit
MSQSKLFTIESTIELNFENSDLRDFSYNSFIPELNKLQTNRSKILLDKKNQQQLIFQIESKDITAFRASMNEIISFGKIIENTIEIKKKF